MSGAGLDFGKQVGPLPMGAWVAVVGAGLGIAYYTRNKAAAAPATVATDPNASAAAGIDPNAVGTGPGWVAVDPPTTGPTANAPVDNDAWGRQAIDYLIAQGYDPALSQAAISLALQGGTGMNIQQWTLWSIALRNLGSPPYPVDVLPPVAIPGPITQPKPAPKPAPAPAPTSGHWIRVAPGDTLRKLAGRFYGDQSKYMRIYNANRHGVNRPAAGKPAAAARAGWLTGPNVHLTVGRFLYVPK